jgi:hypothetical protein
MSAQLAGFWPVFATSASFSQSLLAMWAYVPEGDACVILVLVTIPVDLPASFNIKGDKG